MGAEVDEVSEERRASVVPQVALPGPGGLAQPAPGLGPVPLGQGNQALHPSHLGHQRPRLVAAAHWLQGRLAHRTCRLLRTAGPG